MNLSVLYIDKSTKNLYNKIIEMISVNHSETDKFVY